MSAEFLQLAGLAEPFEMPRDTPARLLLADAPDVMSPETLSRDLDGVKVATLAEWRSGGIVARRGPAFVMLDGLVRYMKPDVVAWLGHGRVATSEQS